MKRKLLIFPVLILFFIVACATTVDHKIQYLTARDSFNLALVNYSERVKAMPDGAEKDDIKARFNPVWKDAEMTLDAWGDVVKGGSELDPTVAVRRFSSAKNKLIQLGLKYFGDRLFSD
jgi:hypothetical protein